MIKFLFSKYKFPLLISLVISILIIALRLETKPLNIILILFGSLIGAFILDLDYMFFTYIVEPKHYFSKNVSESIKKRNYLGALQYISYHKKELRNLPLHSALFQVSLMVLGFYILSSSQEILGKALCLTLIAQMFFEQAKDYAESKKLDEWFWMLKIKPTKQMLIGYFTILSVLFIYFLSLL